MNINQVTNYGSNKVVQLKVFFLTKIDFYYSKLSEKITGKMCIYDQLKW